MKKREVKVGMNVGYKGDIEIYGTVIKLKPLVAVLEVYDSETGDTEIHEIGYDRLWRA